MIKIKPYHIATEMFIVFLFIFYSNTFTLVSDANLHSDGIEYAIDIKDGNIYALFSTWHLFYHIAGFILNKIVLILANNLLYSSMWSLKFLSALFGTLGVYLFYLLILRLNGNKFVAFITSLSLAFSTSYWFFSATPETYIPGSFFIILIFYLFSKLSQINAGSKFFLTLGIVHAIGICMRLDNVLLFPVVVISILFFVEKHERIKNLLYYCLSVGTLTGLIFITIYIVYSLDIKEMPNFFIWLTRTQGFGNLENFTLENFLNVAIGREAIATRRGIYGNTTYLFYIAFLMSLPVVFSRSYRKIFIEWKIIILCMLFVLIRILFFTWWTPYEAFLWLAGTLIPLLLIFAIIISRADKALKGFLKIIQRFLYLCIPLAILIASTSALFPLRKNIYYQTGLIVNSYIDQGNLIVTDDWFFKFCMAYYFDVKSLYLDTKSDKYNVKHVAEDINRTYDDSNGEIYFLLKEHGQPHISNCLGFLESNYNTKRVRSVLENNNKVDVLNFKIWKIERIY